ncbi:MAG: ArsR/SmtB family transcription factor [Bacillota bacterium]
MKDPYGNADNLGELADLLKAIAHPARLCILRGLAAGGENNVSHMQHCMSISQSNLSQHLAKMRSQGLLAARREKNEVYYRIADERILRIVEAIFNYAGDKD